MGRGMLPPQLMMVPPLDTSGRGPGDGWFMMRMRYGMEGMLPPYHMRACRTLHPLVGRGGSGTP